MPEHLLPTCQEFEVGIAAFRANERRGHVYFSALNHMQANWSRPSEIAAGIKMLLDLWHNAFYRFGAFDIDRLTVCLSNTMEVIDHFRHMDIRRMSEDDEAITKQLFNALLDALRGGNRRSPVAVVKALHLLAPGYFPLWDTKIAVAHGFCWVYADFGAKEYIPFCWKMRRVAEVLRECPCATNAQPPRSILKLMDEYYYSKYTKEWIA